MSDDDFTNEIIMLNDLQEWVCERKEKTTPDKMAFVLFIMGSKIIETHAIDKARIPYFIQAALEVGRELSK